MKRLKVDQSKKSSRVEEALKILRADAEEFSSIEFTTSSRTVKGMKVKLVKELQRKAS
jgi:hypothetical protein